MSCIVVGYCSNYGRFVFIFGGVLTHLEQHDCLLLTHNMHVYSYEYTCKLYKYKQPKIHIYMYMCT